MLYFVIAGVTTQSFQWVNCESFATTRPRLSDGYISNVQCHADLTYHFQFLTFGHSHAQG